MDVGYADKIQSARFQDPNLMMCPVWTGFNTVGQPVCADSFYTKREGCNSALDRVAVENNLRPQYAEFINLNTKGYTSDDLYASKKPWADQFLQNQSVDYSNNNFPNFGTQFSNVTYKRCNPSTEIVANESFNNRARQYSSEGYESNAMRRCSGM
jgi:hypothetical protein